MKLEEDKTYLFSSLKTVDLPGGDTNLILLGPDGKKYLLPLKYYKDYNLPLNSLISCKVDKINCSGKVFLEPAHPVYREGENYEFIIGEYLTQQASGSGLAKVAKVHDEYGNQAYLDPSLLKNHPEPGTKVNIRIERISKGKIYFRSKEETENIDGLEEGKTYSFRIDRIFKRADNEEFYIAVDAFGHEHPLYLRYYTHYGFSVGDTFKGRIVRYAAGRKLTIEPENPWFKPGDIIEVTITGFKAIDTGEGYIAEAFDKNGFIHRIMLEEKPVSQIVKCRVLKLRKGKPVLTILPMN